MCWYIFQPVQQLRPYFQVNISQNNDECYGIFDISGTILNQCKKNYQNPFSNKDAVSNIYQKLIKEKCIYFFFFFMESVETELERKLNK